MALLLLSTCGRELSAPLLSLTELDCPGPSPIPDSGAHPKGTGLTAELLTPKQGW